MISVCIPTYNGEKYLKEQLESILCQIHDCDEVVISDDGSTDATLKIIASFKDKRLKVLKNEPVRSPIFNLERALVACKGEYIFLADQDDVWLQNRINRVLPLLKNYTTVVNNCNLINGENQVTEDSFFRMNNSKGGLFKNFYKNSYLGCCLAVKREILQYALPFPKDIAMHDIWIGLVSEIYGNSIFIDDVLVSYRRHNENFSPTSEASNFSFRKRLMIRFNFAKNLFYLHLNRS